MEKLAKELRIQTGVAERLNKEMLCYQRDVDKERERLKKMKEAEEVDEYRVRKQEEVIQETLGMVPNTRLRLKTALEQLQKLLVEAGKAREQMAEKELELFAKAESVVERINAQSNGVEA